MDKQLFQSVFIVNSYTHSVIIKHVQQINRLLSAPYDDYYDIYGRSMPIGYYNWYQLIEDPIQLARHGYFDQLQSTIRALEQKFAKYKWFDDDNENGDEGDQSKKEKQQQQQQQRKWIPNLKEIIKCIARYPLILKSRGDIINKQYQFDDQSIVKKRNQFIQDFMYKRYGVDNLEEFMKALIKCSFKVNDSEVIKWIESINNDCDDNILIVLDKYNINHNVISKHGNQDMVYHCFKMFQSPSYKSMLLTLKDEEVGASFDNRLNDFFSYKDEEDEDEEEGYATLISNLFGNGHMPTLSLGTQYNILKRSIKTNHPRLMEMIDYFAQDPSISHLLVTEQIMNLQNRSAGALQIIRKLISLQITHVSLGEKTMASAIARGDMELVDYLIAHKVEINMEVAARVGNFEILEMGIKAGRTCSKFTLMESGFFGQLETFKWVNERFPLLLKEIEIESFITMLLDRLKEQEETTSKVNFDKILKMTIKDDDDKSFAFVKILHQLAIECGYTFKPTFLYIFKDSCKSETEVMKLFKYLSIDQDHHIKYFGQDIEAHVVSLEYCIGSGWLEPSKLLIKRLHQISGGCANTILQGELYLSKFYAQDVAIKSGNIPTIKFVLDHFPLDKQQQGQEYLIRKCDDLDLLRFIYETFKDHRKMVFCHHAKISNPRVFKYLVEKNLIDGEKYRGRTDACHLLIHAGFDAIAWLLDHGNVKEELE
ncbi:hypothetical protein DFA_00109 [Cavenderia fasciculata]|uniref:Ankyrin repeat-containing protein n=1 Tax=Cavenderia fasciculata TaxID=261658 RepID=F4PXM1_CACFS|nr:uncharacterized protein DFA_00109 [Cavenderia fasciculata]EGG19531.1 hypothetical protein DFA_00109 [Cavenderia fasciculata]|eukprot:XP_004357825.1 hypothetical protein DFA_00109 [Cavenderia fasciculata]